MTTRSGHAGHLNFKIDRLREFQTWYRTVAAVALPSQRSFQDSPDLIRSLRLPMTCPSAYVAALVAYCWCDSFRRVAIAYAVNHARPIVL